MQCLSEERDCVYVFLKKICDVLQFFKLVFTVFIIYLIYNIDVNLVSYLFFLIKEFFSIPLLSFLQKFYFTLIKESREMKSALSQNKKKDIKPHKIQ